jgi:hypothetical protein
MVSNGRPIARVITAFFVSIAIPIERVFAIGG